MLADEVEADKRAHGSDGIGSQYLGHGRSRAIGSNRGDCAVDREVAQRILHLLELFGHVGTDFVSIGNTRVTAIVQLPEVSNDLSGSPKAEG